MAGAILSRHAPRALAGRCDLPDQRASASEPVEKHLPDIGDDHCLGS
jgi:hypothetical protein